MTFIGAGSVASNLVTAVSTLNAGLIPQELVVDKTAEMKRSV